jgi:hypothetical protein
MPLEQLRAQLCRAFGITIPQQDYVAKSSRKARGTKSTPKKKSVKTKYKNSTPSKSLKKILKSPSIKSRLVAALSSSPRHAADPHAANGDEDDDSEPADEDRKPAAAPSGRRYSL